MRTPVTVSGWARPPPAEKGAGPAARGNRLAGPQDFLDGAIPHDGDLVVCKEAGLQDLLGAEIVAPVDERHLVGEVGKEERVLDGGIAAADHHDLAVAVSNTVVTEATRPWPTRPILFEERGHSTAKLLGLEGLVLEERELPAVERLGEGRVAVREPEPHEQLGGERRAELVEPGRLSGRLRRGDREDGPDAVGPSVERLEEHGACGERRRGRKPDRADRVGDLGGRVRHVLLRAERGTELEHAVAVGLATEPQREQAASLRPVAGKLTVGGDADANARAELALDAARQPDEGSDGRVRAALAEQRVLQLRVAALECLVVPVEAPARLGDAHEKIDEDRAKQRVVLGRLAAGVRARIDRGGALAVQLLERNRRVVTPAETAGAGLDEVAHERPVLVEGGPVTPAVLLEREGQRLAGVVELAEQVCERAQGERAERVVELRRANGHAPQLGATGGIPVRRARETDERLLVEDDRAAASELHDPVPLRVAEDAVDGRAGRAGEGGDVLLDQGNRDRCSAAEDAGELEHPPCDAGLRADGVRLDEPLRQRRDALGEEPHENLVDRRMHPREAP